MSKETKIQWCDSTVNPVMGCDGCEIWNSKRRTCYAGVLHGRYHANPGYADSFDVPVEFPGRMAAAAKWKPLGRWDDRPGKPWLNGQRRLIFVSDMGDALSGSISFDYLYEEIIRVAMSDRGRAHRWLWLTKRPRRMREFYRWLMDNSYTWPMNLWPMTSISGHGTVTRASFLREVGPPGIIRGISFEPLISEPDWDFCLSPSMQNNENGLICPISWAIFGGESGSNPRAFNANILRRGIRACRERGIPVFVKQMGVSPVGLRIKGRLKDGHGGDWSEWPDEFKVREIPSEHA